MASFQEQNRQYTILVVEDEATVLQVITGYLSSYYHILIAKTRQKALELLESKEIDIVLLDVNLPDGNGFEICYQVRTHKEIYGDICIIFMTGLESSDDEITGLKLGANDYIHKPINCTVLKARVDLQAELIRKTRLLSELTKIDGLTEIPNRRAFDEQLKQEWNRAKREGKLLSLALLDIDYFKQFNDTYGHPAGDLCLKKLAWCLKESFQRSSDFYARYGGEEFAVILYDAGLDDAVEKLNATLNKLVELDIEHKSAKQKDYVTFSTGLSTANPTKDDFENFLESADKLLYQAKENGRSQVCGRLLSDI